MNAANEVANEAFRANRCSFLDIEHICTEAVEKIASEPVENLEQLAEADAAARRFAASLIGA